MEVPRTRARAQRREQRITHNEGEVVGKHHLPVKSGVLIAFNREQTFAGVQNFLLQYHFRDSNAGKSREAFLEA
jgi:hypothetical protein